MVLHSFPNSYLKCDNFTGMCLCCCCLSHSVVSNSATLWSAACQASLSFTIFQSLLKVMSIESVMPSNHLLLYCPLLLLSSIFPSTKVFSGELALYIRWPMHWSFSFSISPSSEYSGLIFFRIDLFGLLCPRDSEKSSPAPEFKGLNSLAVSLFYCLWQ